MDFYFPIKHAFSVKPCSGIAILLWSCGLLFFYLSVQGILNDRKIYIFGDIFSSSFLRFPTSDVDKEYVKRYNLMDGPAKVDESCTLDYINDHKVAQDHPCVIKLIRQLFMNPPPPRDVPYNIYDHLTHDAEIMQILKNKRNGFFVECGAFDGVLKSNTLDMEMNYNWTGLLIEGSPVNYKDLITRKRKSWTFPLCLSLKPYPTKVMFANSDHGEKSVFRIMENDESGGKIYHINDVQNGLINVEETEVQCFPFYSILLASNRTTIDYFSLDVEGHEIKVLKTIPWKRVNIKTMRIETILIPDTNNKNGSDALKEWLEGEPGYTNFKKDIPPFYDAIYMKDCLNKN